MSTNQQSELGEFDKPETATQCDRQRCSRETTKGEQCRNPVVPIEGIEVCTVHLGESDDSSSSDDRPVWDRQNAELLGDSE